MAAAVHRFQISRRQFVQGAGVAGLALLAGCGRLPLQAPPPAKVPRIAFLWTGPASLALTEPSASNLAAFQQGLRDLGYVEGQNISVDVRFAESDGLLRGQADELVGLPVDVIVTSGTPATRAAREATDTIPIVMTAIGDPIGSGFVASLARPGGNVTGSTQISSQLSGKRLELLQAAAPAIRHVAVLSNPTNASNTLSWEHTQEASRALGLQLQLLDVQGTADFGYAFDSALQSRADALLTLPDAMINANVSRIVDFAARGGLPAMYAFKHHAAAGGLIAYEANIAGLYARAAYYVDRILKGAKPADLPVEQPMIFDFVINLKTAQALGLTIPPHVLLQATEVIQ